MKVFAPEALAGAPEGFQSKAFRSKDLVGHLLTIQVDPDDCTGCGVCVDVCPAKSKTEVKHKSINMEPAPLHRDRDASTGTSSSPSPNWTVLCSPRLGERFPGPPAPVRVLRRLLGCGETPYLKLASQLFGDRMLVANATGCSSIYGGNLPTTPWAKNVDGRGRPGPTPCSRTMPSSAWASAWASRPRSAGRGAVALARRSRRRRPGGLGPRSRPDGQDNEEAVLAQRRRVAQLDEPAPPPGRR